MQNNLSKYDDSCYNFLGDIMKSYVGYLVCAIILIILGIVVFFKATSYTLTFVVDGSAYQTLNVRKNASANTITTPMKDGYVFIGWYDENGNLFDADSTILEDAVYYARWAIIDTSTDS